MRIRTIKPEFWRHPVMGRLSNETKLVAICLLSIADDEGYFRADPALIRSDAFPFNEGSVNIHGALTELSNVGWIVVRKHPEQGQIGLVVKFQKHQKINRPTASRLRAYYEFSEPSLSPHGALMEPSLPEQGTGNREGGKAKPLPNGFAHELKEGRFRFPREQKELRAELVKSLKAITGNPKSYARGPLLKDPADIIEFHRTNPKPNSEAEIKRIQQDPVNYARGPLLAESNAKAEDIREKIRLVDEALRGEDL